MRAAVIADLHGNFTATQALEKDLARRGIDRLWCLGDIVGKGPSSDKTFDWALSRCEFILRGNWDEGIGAAMFANDAFYYEQLGHARLKKLLEFPLEMHMTLGGRRLRLMHGRPVMPLLLYPQGSDDALQALFEPDFDVVGYADTHRQGLRTLKGLLFNTGSVGNSMGVNMLQYAIIQGEDGADRGPLDISFVSLPYDIEKAVQETLAQPDLPNGELFIRELRTGVYARKGGTPGK